MAVTIGGRVLLYAEMFSAVIDSNMHNRLALNWIKADASTYMF